MLAGVAGTGTGELKCVPHRMGAKIRVLVLKLLV